MFFIHPWSECGSMDRRMPFSVGCFSMYQSTQKNKNIPKILKLKKAGLFFIINKFSIFPYINNI